MAPFRLRGREGARVGRYRAKPPGDRSPSARSAALRSRTKPAGSRGPRRWSPSRIGCTEGEVKRVMEFEAYDIALIPVIVALVGVATKMGVGPRFQPAVALALGLIGGFVYVAPEDPKQAVLTGLVMGLSAIGAYSGVKNTIEKRDP